MQDELKAIRERNQNNLSRILREHGLRIPLDAAMEHYSEFSLFDRREKECRSCPHDNPEKVYGCYKPVFSYDAETKSLSVRFSGCPYAKELSARLSYEKTFEEMTIAKRFQNRTFENFRVTSTTRKIYDFIKDWADTFEANKKGLYIFGEYGSGKSHLAVAALLEVHNRFHVTGAFLVFPDYLERLKSTFGNDAEGEKLFSFYAKAPLLVLDDIGGGRRKDTEISQWANEQLFRLVNYRYEYELPTIITSTLTPSDLNDLLLSDTVSRLAEMCVFVKNRAEDYRMKQICVFP